MYIYVVHLFSGTSGTYIAFNFFHGFDTPDEDICI